MEVLTCCVFGREGFGEVYSAEQVYLGTLGAVKILSLRGDQQVRDLIRAEARISARLRHPHLIPMVDFGFEEEVPYLVMMDAVHGTLFPGVSAASGVACPANRAGAFLRTSSTQRT